jgi:hypothetical protein
MGGNVNSALNRFIMGIALASLMGCTSSSGEVDDPAPLPETWAWVARAPKAALLSVHGTAADDVWMVGADAGQGPAVLHWDGAVWQTPRTNQRGDLWWVHALDDGPVFMGGSDALLLRYSDGAFQRLQTPGLGKHTVFGIGGVAADDVYAVGAAAGRNGFIWHYDGREVSEIELPEDLPLDEFNDAPGFFKVWAASADEVWIVGARGVVLRGNARDGFEVVRSGEDEILFTVHGQGEHVAIVGGTSTGVLLEGSRNGLEDRAPERTPLLQGVHVEPRGAIWAVGTSGSIYRARDGSFEPIDPGLSFAAGESLHAVWVDPKGGVWAVGGDLTAELDKGLALHSSESVPETSLEPPSMPEPACPSEQIDRAPDASIARRWNEQILNAIRRDTPRPGVHARNLFHLSIAFWDAHSAFDSKKDGYLIDDKLEAADADAAREEAISYAAYRVLSHRYSPAVGGAISQACFDAFMDRLGYDPEDTGDSGDSPRALGNRIGHAIIDDYADDGANESENYEDPEGFLPETDTLVVDKPGTSADDPTLWQRLVLAKAETQNGIPGDAGAQGYIGPHWGSVTPFSLVRPRAGEAYLDIGEPPVALDDRLVDYTVEVLRRSAELDVMDETLIDISPGGMGNNPLGTNDGTGYAQNPVTGEPYRPQRVKRSDFGRVLAEFWADGPASETPPGHWNTMANHLADDPELERRLFGEGEELDPLAWDVHVYLAMNGALHDAAIAAWELKRKYLTARPITLIRYMGGRGQRSDPDAPSYDPEGLPLIDDLIEIISEQSSQRGERHAHLRRYVGEIAVRSWRGEPGDRKNGVGGCGWIRAREWTPYQRRTFVTPAFPGYVSGHSTFSRAAATVLAELTGSPAFPGGHASYTFEPGYLFFEHGPSAPITLEWATYFDAADQAGQSRVWGGIHVSADDFDGRRVGARVGASAIELSRTYFDGSARP